MPFNDNPSMIPGGSEGLRVLFEEFKDRSAPAYFAGRKHILSDIEKTGSEIWYHHQHGMPQVEGSTKTIFGAPGAGKSSTLKFLKHYWSNDKFMTSNSDGSKRSGPSPVMLYSGDSQIMHSLAFFCKNLVEVVAPGRGDKLFATISETIRKSAGVNLGFAEGGLQSEQTRQLTATQAGIHAIAKALPPEKWTRPVIIGVDEAQNLPGDDNSPVGKLLQALHTNDHNLPVMVVLAGLSNLKIRVNELGLSRLSANCTYSLEGLNTDEIDDLRKGFCSHFEINLGQRISDFDELLRRTDGWPAHVQNCLRAFAKVYLDADCDITAVDFAEVERLSQASRMQYYHDRMSYAMEESSRLLGLLMTRLTGSERRGDVLRIIKQIDIQHDGDEDPTLHLPDDMTVREFYYDLVHRGALQERDDKTVICPIPSFRQYMIEVGKQSGQINTPSEMPRYQGLPWDAIERIEEAHTIRNVH